jgi:hypothetical protein
MRVQGDISHWCEVIEIGIPVPGLGDGFLSPAQFLVLHLQFDLVYLEFVHQLQNIIRGQLPQAQPSSRQ